MEIFVNIAQFEDDIQPKS